MITRFNHRRVQKLAQSFIFDRTPTCNRHKHMLSMMCMMYYGLLALWVLTTSSNTVVTFISIISQHLSVKHTSQQMTDKITVTCIKHYFPHLLYAVYCCARHAQHAVNCVIAAVTWSDLCTNHRHSAFFILHFIFHILQFCILPVTISDHASVLLTVLFLLKLPYTRSWLELPMPTFCCFKPHVHY